MHKNEILDLSGKEFAVFSDYCKTISEEFFFRQPADKWSIAQNVDHLIRSMQQTKRVYSLPKFIVRLYVGKPNRPSRSFETLVEKYKDKLARGGRASGVFVPKPVTNISKEDLLKRWKKICDAYLQVVEKKWKDEQLDAYLAPHPLLGKITLRELCYFSIFHTGHHLEAIKKHNP